jgi:rubredoxin
MGNDYPSDWGARRKRVYARDNYTCQNCGTKGGKRGNQDLHAHHVVPKSNGGTHKESNLIAVCKECHKAIHGNSTAPSAGRESISDLSLPGSIETFNDYRKVLMQLSVLLGMGSNSGQLSDMEQHKQILAQDAYWAYQYEDQYSSSIKSDILDMKNTLAHNQFSHDSKEVKNTVDEIVSKSIQALGLLAEYTNKIIKYHELTKSVKCPKCQSLQDVDSDFCGDCGEELPLLWECPECGGSEDTLNESFCTSCGSELNEFPVDQRDELEDIKQDCIDTWNKADSLLGEDINNLVQNEIPPSLLK